MNCFALFPLTLALLLSAAGAHAADAHGAADHAAAPAKDVPADAPSKAAVDDHGKQGADAGAKAATDEPAKPAAGKRKSKSARAKSTHKLTAHGGTSDVPASADHAGAHADAASAKAGESSKRVRVKDRQAHAGSHAAADAHAPQAAKGDTAAHDTHSDHGAPAAKDAHAPAAAHDAHSAHAPAKASHEPHTAKPDAPAEPAAAKPDAHAAHHGDGHDAQHGKQHDAAHSPAKGAHEAHGTHTDDHAAHGKPAQAAADECNPPLRSEVAALFDRWNASLRTGDPKKVVANYAPNSVLLPTVSNRARFTAAEKEDYFHHFLARRPEGRIDDRLIEADCNTATDAGLYTFRFSDGTSVRARYSFSYRKIGGEWLITSHHSSAMPEKAEQVADGHAPARPDREPGSTKGWVRFP